MELEVRCQWRNGATLTECLYGFETRWIDGATVKLGPCPACHGRAAVPTMLGHEVIEFVRFWSDRERP